MTYLPKCDAVPPHFVYVIKRLLHSTEPVACMHAEDSPPTKPSDTEGKSIRKLSSLVSLRQPRAHHTEYTFNLVLSTRRAAVSLALLEDKLAAIANNS